ncbi:hypothetical protein V1477_010718 [Vespula maculifrons]|uniref:Uncharacterized protein n=1 Tax=Vespula maculifrons TaxID=7453 RepID=A0ABD2C2Q3_VESMC
MVVKVLDIGSTNVGGMPLLNIKIRRLKSFPIDLLLSTYVIECLFNEECTTDLYATEAASVPHLADVGGYGNDPIDHSGRIYFLSLSRTLRYYSRALCSMLKQIDGPTETDRVTYVAGDEVTEFAMVPLNLRQVHFSYSSFRVSIGSRSESSHVVSFLQNLLLFKQYCTSVLKNDITQFKQENQFEKS